MTKLLEKAIAEIRKLPDDRQDEAAEVLLSIASQDPDDYRLSPEQLADLQRGFQAPPITRLKPRWLLPFAGLCVEDRLQAARAC